MNGKSYFTEAEYCPYKYASVRLLDSPYHMDKLYEYRIPDSCRERIRKGSFVVLPYGNGNRRVIGVVIGFSDCTDYDELRIKMIDGLASERLALFESTLSLCEFMKKRYLCTFGDAAKLMLPPGALGSLRESYSVTPSGSRASIEATDVKNYELLRYIADHGTVTRDELSLSFPRFSRESIEELIEKRYVFRSLDVSERKDAHETVVSLAMPLDNVVYIIHGKDKKLSCARKTKGACSNLSPKTASVRYPLSVSRQRYQELR